MKFQVGDKVEVILSEHCSLNEVGDMGTITKLGPTDALVIVKERASVVGSNEYGGWHTFDELKLVKPKQTKNQRITALEKEVAELKIIVEDLRERKAIEPINISAAGLIAIHEQPSKIIEFEGAKYRKVEREAREGDVVIILNQNEETNAFKLNKPYKVLSELEIRSCNPDHEGSLYGVYVAIFGRTPETVDVYELIEQPKSANLQRAEIIANAKKFVEVKSEYLKDSTLLPGGYERKKIENPNYCGYKMKVEFITKKDERLVIALLKYSDGELETKSIAKCNLSDVFNEHIGKAIALGRALGLDVSEFEQAVQPTHYAVGQIAINERLGTKCQFEVIKIGEGETFKKKFEPYTVSYGDTTKPLNFEDENSKSLTIINDTNAIYGEVK
ncbi:TPA: hypothetical protein NJY08_004378 [Salmonella enterica subsp. enterica serovar Typhi str. AG3]|nr:hypothetical protein [Salmonella enterica subsp. enterica serovar Typhi str. AG3]